MENSIKSFLCTTYAPLLFFIAIYVRITDLVQTQISDVDADAYDDAKEEGVEALVYEDTTYNNAIFLTFEGAYISAATSKMYRYKLVLLRHIIVESIFL